eukprot:EG_transcript_17697
MPDRPTPPAVGDRWPARHRLPPLLLAGAACAALVLASRPVGGVEAAVLSHIAPSAQTRRLGGVQASSGAEDVDEFRRKLMDNAISGRRFEKWTTKGREAKALREALQEAQRNPEPQLNPLEHEVEEFEGADPTTADSFTFGDAGMERAEMQPANELEDLRSRPFATWPEKGDSFWRTRVAGVFLTTLAVLLGLTAVTSDVGVERVGVAYVVLLAALVTALFVFRLWSDWTYVGDRLRDTQVFYEKSGWYDGELWRKPPEVAKRDQLLYSFQVKPVLDRLRPALAGSVGLCAAALAALLTVRPADPYAEVPRPPVAQSYGAPAPKFARLEDAARYELVR